MRVRQEDGVGVIAIQGEMTGFAEEALMNAYNCLLYTSRCV